MWRNEVGDVGDAFVVVVLCMEIQPFQRRRALSRWVSIWLGPGDYLGKPLMSSNSTEQLLVRKLEYLNYCKPRYCVSPTKNTPQFFP